MTSAQTQAIVIGATGLVGAEIIAQLLLHKPEIAVTSYARRPVMTDNENWTQIVAPFADLAKHRERLKGTVAFSALGTTKKQAGSIEAQHEVDYTYQLEFAKAVRAQGVARFVLISSGGANATSSFAYLKMKGELERDIATLNFASFHILRPGLLVGRREDARRGEVWLKPIGEFFGKLPGLASLHPVAHSRVATYAVAAGLRGRMGQHRHEPEAVWRGPLPGGGQL